MDRAILVDNIPDRDKLGASEEKVRDRLTIHFQKESNGGGDVETLLYPLPSFPSKAIVVFNSKFDMDKLTTHNQQVKINGKKSTVIKVTVTRLPQIFTSIKVAINPFYLNVLPREETDLFNRELASAGGIESIDGNMWINMNTIDRINYASSVILNAVGVESRGKHIEIQNGAPQAEAISNRHSAEPEHAKISTLSQNSTHSLAHSKDNRLKPSNKMGAVFPDRNTDIGELQSTNDRDNESVMTEAGKLPPEDAETQQQQSQPRQQGPFAVIPLLYHYLLQRHNEIQAIEKQYKVVLDMVISTLPDHSNRGGMVTISSKSADASIEDLIQAENEFVTFYQKYFDLYTVRTLPIEVSDEMFRKAEKMMSSRFPDVLIDVSIEGEISFVGKKKEVSKAVEIFQESTGLRVPRRLKKVRSGNLQQRSEDEDTLQANPFNGENFDYSKSGARPRTHQHQLNNFGSNSNSDYSFWINNSMEVVIQQGDITHQRVDIVVSPTDETLHHGGGVANALSMAAGRMLSEECSQIKRARKYKRLSVGECVVTNGHMLPCEKVIHVVGPEYSKRISDDLFFQDLQNTFINCLKEANNFHDTSTIAIPLISSGMNGGPKHVCASALIVALQEFGHSANKSSIKKIYLVNKDEHATSALMEVSKTRVSKEGTTSKGIEYLNDPNREETPMDIDEEMDDSHFQPAQDFQNSTKAGSLETASGFGWSSTNIPDYKKKKTFLSKAGLKITIAQDELQNCKNNDALINPSNDSLFQTGVAKVIGDLAGPQLIKEYTANSNMRAFPLAVKDIIMTGGYNLGCDKVIHILIPHPEADTPRTLTYNMIRDVILQSLQHADLALKVKSAVIPMGNYDSGKHTPELYVASVAEALKDFGNGSVLNMKRVYVVNPKLEIYMAMEGAFADQFDDISTSEDNDTKPRRKHKIENWSGGKDDRNAEGNGEENRGNGEENSQDEDDEDTRCPICFDDFEGNTDLKTLDLCKHKFCRPCIDRAMKDKPACPVCGKMYGVMKGNQPPGTMTTSEYSYSHLPGYPGCGYIQINYSFNSGTQGPNHPNPGKYYTGTSRTAYLPNNREGQQVLKLLRKAFDANLTFTIGTSVTTGRSDTVTWNDIHHKTSMHGGPQSFGYPDPTYLKRVTEELAAKGIK